MDISKINSPIINVDSSVSPKPRGAYSQAKSNTQEAYGVELSEKAQEIAAMRMEQKQMDEGFDAGKIPDDVLSEAFTTYHSLGKYKNSI